MKCLVYGIYILEFAQSVLIAESVFQNYELFLTGFGGSQALQKHGTTWFSFPILTAIGELSCVGHGGRHSNILARYSRRPGVLRASDQCVGTIEDNRRGNYCCKLSKVFYCQYCI